ncbi:uncharacterized protein LOC114533464 [Dendronephthya gigantea]|uniref:uncharacterized protein LOC114533464 n=1 Tax=Dendronephthya gigantea TaxID=151771 RepID=UPI00106A7228|nr:uncharacterized protein LOC114533464 [Dendronephthya gigantea]
MVNITNLETMTCDHEQKSCGCGKKYGYNTVVYNTDEKIVKCIKDEDVAGDIVGHDGSYLKNGDGECLGVKNQIISTTNCSKDDLSQRWLWTGFGNIMNLKVHKCLRWNNSTQKLITEQCNTANIAQIWKQSDRELLSNGRTLYNNFTGSEQYQGFYRFPRDELMAMVKKGNCFFHNKNCHINLTINAPIFRHPEKPAACNITWNSSVYSVWGQKWKSFSPTNSKKFMLKPIDTERISLNIANGKRFFKKWSGTLIRLSINCVIEEHCVVLKIEGSWEKKTKKISSPTTPAFNSRTTSSNSASSPDGSQLSSMVFIVPVVVLFCLLIVALVIIVYYRRRMRRLKSEQDRPVSEDCSANPLASYEDPTLQKYDSPGITIHDANHYERPTDIPDQPISRQNDQNDNEFHYDYATREETSVLSFGVAKPCRKQNSDTCHCSHTVDNTEPLQPSEKRDDQASEDDSFWADDDNKPAYQQEPQENPDSHTADKHIYHTLEEDSPENDNS